MNKEKIQALLNVIVNTPLVQVDDSPYLHSCNTSEIENKPENEVLCFNWTDDEGQDFIIKFTETNLDNAKVFGNKIILADHEYQPSEICLFTLLPVNIPIEMDASILANK